MKFHAAYDCPDDHEIWVVMELLEGGNLDDAVGGGHTEFAECHVAFAAREILKALSYLHGRQIAHRYQMTVCSICEC